MTSNIVITPSAALSNATIKINGSTVVSGTASGGIALNEGANTIGIVVTAPAGIPSKTYTLLVRRGCLVTTTADAGAGSLRQAFALDPDTITFAPALSGLTIGLSRTINAASSVGVMVDASTLPGGVTISGQGSVRIFVNSGILTLRALPWRTDLSHLLATAARS